MFSDLEALVSKPEPARDPRGFRRLAGSTEMSRFVHRVFLDTPPPAPRVVVVCGVRGKVGCSKMCAVITKALAEETEQRVCAVDGNFASPSLHRQFDSSNQAGLLEVLTLGRSAESLAQQVSPPNCWILPHGRQGVKKHSILASPEIQGCVDELRNQFEFVVIDAPPLSFSQDAIAFGKCSDGAILIAERGGTSMGDASSAKRRLDRARITLLGVVMTN